MTTLNRKPWDSAHICWHVYAELCSKGLGWYMKGSRFGKLGEKDKDSLPKSEMPHEQARVFVSWTRARNR